jgi:hypothetical protein
MSLPKNGDKKNHPCLGPFFEPPARRFLLTAKSPLRALFAAVEGASGARAAPALSNEPKAEAAASLARHVDQACAAKLRYYWTKWLEVT